jgi:hypothetical protein
LFSNVDAETALLMELILSRLAAGAFTPNEADEEPPAAGKKRLGGAQEGRSWSSPAPRIDNEEKAGTLLPLPKKAVSPSVSSFGVPGSELPGVEKGELAE